jgi:hypothetical protein
VNNVPVDVVSNVVLSPVSDYNLAEVEKLMLERTPKGEVRKIWTIYFSQNNNVLKAVNEKLGTNYTHNEMLAEAVKKFAGVDCKAEFWDRTYNYLQVTHDRLTGKQIAAADTTDFVTLAVTKAAKNLYNKMRTTQTEPQIIDEMLKQKINPQIISKFCLSYKVE